MPFSHFRKRHLFLKSSCSFNKNPPYNYGSNNGGDGLDGIRPVVIRLFLCFLASMLVLNGGYISGCNHANTNYLCAVVYSPAPSENDLLLN